jgi:hypothetical protein
LKPELVLDYGCGQSKLFELIEKAGFRVARYDPAIPDLNKVPEGKYDLITCIDVMEHIPESHIEDVMDHISELSNNVIFIIDTIPAKNILPDGRNAHVTVKDATWWRERLRKHFPTVAEINVRPRWRAAFRTWPIHPLERPSLHLNLLKWKIKKSLRFGPFN